MTYLEITQSTLYLHADKQGNSADAHLAEALILFWQQCYTAKWTSVCEKVSYSTTVRKSPQPLGGSTASAWEHTVTWQWSLPGMTASGRNVPRFAEQGLFFTDFCTSLKSCACNNTPLSQPVISGGHCFWWKWVLPTAWHEIKRDILPDQDRACITSTGNSCPLDKGKTQDK